jgi:hypothetical protein
MDFVISWSFYVQTSTKKKLLEEHWPKIIEWLGTETTLGEVVKRVENKGPFHLFATTPVKVGSEAEAVLRCLELALAFSWPWHVACIERDDQKRITGFLGGWKGSGTPGKHMPPIVSAVFLMFEAGAVEMLDGGIAMRVVVPRSGE